MFAPIPLNLPPCSLKLTKGDNCTYVYDELRKKKLVLTPEEWVRQHWIHYLHNYKNYPKSLMQIEGGLVLNTLQKRSDLLIYNTAGAKILLAEFKAPTVKISEKTFSQIANYNKIHKIPLLLVSNGIEHYYCTIDFEREDFTFLEELPTFQNSSQRV
ncbi:type I restriction enzyme HsdR N-terminal domain-containing protein [Sphingobacterium corticibacter]|uniref:Restriction endonuclease subunit R n=1 Tax=Sphingobacterium corticibacter TaxID=2171749 RepID=A0A2T8HEY1_9SPHI|nr:type I restriction enzyme HsdR N-terminal domain-containing protein [Sphingobacterium corticibacter]PVH23975.1 restriction endonuclease subunit R [Sphingobacterium corticibacter]